MKYLLDRVGIHTHGHITLQHLILETILKIMHFPPIVSRYFLLPDLTKYADAFHTCMSWWMYTRKSMNISTREHNGLSSFKYLTKLKQHTEIKLQPLRWEFQKLFHSMWVKWQLPMMATRSASVDMAVEWWFILRKCFVFSSYIPQNCDHFHGTLRGSSIRILCAWIQFTSSCSLLWITLLAWTWLPVDTTNILHQWDVMFLVSGWMECSCWRQ
jgi:hypothetical protein